MNENLNLVEILKDCPYKTPLYSIIHGDVEFLCIDRNNHTFPIKLLVPGNYHVGVTKEGKYIYNGNGECILFPSKDQRDWSKFKVKKPKFDPTTLMPFDNVLIILGDTWKCAIFSHLKEIRNGIYRCECIGSSYPYCIPYNEETKHLVGTSEEAPEFYRYWEE